MYQARLTALSLESVIKDPKTRLQEWLQSRKSSLPEYELVEVSGEAHEQHFKISCTVDYNGNKVTHGSGPSRRHAEQQAAEVLLNLLLDMQKS